MCSTLSILCMVSRSSPFCVLCFPEHMEGYRKVSIEYYHIYMPLNYSITSNYVIYPIIVLVYHVLGVITVKGLVYQCNLIVLVLYVSSSSISYTPSLIQFVHTVLPYNSPAPLLPFIAYHIILLHNSLAIATNISLCV